MRILVLVWLIVFLPLTVTCGKVTDKFSFQPDYPQQAQEIIVTYNPSGTSLENANEITLLAYCLSEDVSNVKEVTIKKFSEAWRGAFTIDDTTLAVYIIFKYKALQDDNGQKGYLVPIFGKDRKPIKGALATQAKVAYTGGYEPLNLWRNTKKSLLFYEKEFDLYPEQRRNWRMLDEYWYMLSEFNKDSAAQIIKSQLDQLAKNEEKTSDEIGLLANWYGRINEPVLAAKYKEELQKIEPQDFSIEIQRYRECSDARSISRKRELTIAFIKDFPNSHFIEYLHNKMISAYAQRKQYQQALNYLDANVKNPSSRFLSSLARDMIDGAILPEKALLFAKNAVKTARQEMATEKKPGNYTQKQWQEEQNNRLAKLIELYGSGLYKFGKIEESIPVFKEAVQLNSRIDSDIPKQYCRLLYESGKLKEAFDELRLQLKTDPLSDELRTLYKKVVHDLKKNEKEVDSFISRAEKEYRAELQMEVKGQMLDMPAPSFTLKDLDGKTVSLTDYKDKIVVLDFWATWCTWCLKSFPAMQKSMVKNRNDNKVKFLFIDTWESRDNFKRHVRSIIRKNNYPFHILLDVDDSVADDYNVPALPTKIIVGPDGKIRFRIRGFDNDSKLIEELDLMFEML